MRIALIWLALGGSLLSAQGISGGSIQGTVTDEQNKPVAGAYVTVSRTFVASAKTPEAAFSETVKTASDGSFLARSLPAGTYSYCARIAADGYLNGCQWTPSLDLTVSNGKTVRAGIKLTKGSILKVRVLDPANLAAQKSQDGKNLPIMMGVWDGRGHFLPVHNTGKDGAGLDYQLTVPLNRQLSFQIISPKLKLSDAAGLALPSGSASQTSFQHNSGDPNPKSFQFTITGVNP